MLNSSLDGYKAFCPNEKILFTCVTKNTTTITWRSTALIDGGDNQIQLNTDLLDPGQGEVDDSPYGETVFAYLISESDDSATTEMRVVTPQDYMPSSTAAVSVTCTNNDLNDVKAITYFSAGNEYMILPTLME